MKILRGLFLFMLGGLIATVLLEGYLRVVESTGAWRILPVAEVSLYTPDIESGYTHRPGASGIWTTEHRARVSITDDGYRSNGGEPVAADKQTIILGNSFVEALQVADHQTFTALAEQAFTTAGQPVSVVNGGIAGANPAVIAGRIKTLPRAETPQHIYIFMPLMTILATIDTQANGTIATYEIVNGKATFVRPYLESRGFKFRSSEAGKFMYGMIGEFHVLALLNNRKNRGLLDEWPVTASRKNPASAPTLSCQTEFLAEFMKPDSPRHKMVASFVDDVAAAAKAEDIPVTFLTYDEDGDCPGTTLGDAQKQFAKSLHSQSMTLVDLQPMITAQGVSINNLKGFKKGSSGHFNHKGHAMIGSILYDVIKSDIN